MFQDGGFEICRVRGNVIRHLRFSFFVPLRCLRLSTKGARKQEIRGEKAEHFIENRHKWGTTREEPKLCVGPSIDRDEALCQPGYCLGDARQKGDHIWSNIGE